jgi:hypothetical protein
MTDFPQLTAPDDVRPGQFGIILETRVLMSDIASTIVDLAQRQVIRVDEGPDGSWLIKVPGSRGDQDLTGYEQTLVRSLPAGPVPLGKITGAVPLETRKALIHDAVTRGWLKHLNHTEGTRASSELADQIRAFRRQLAQLRREHGPAALTGTLLPYAVRLDLVTGAEAPLARLGQDWVDRFVGLPGWHTSKTPASISTSDRDMHNAMAIMDAIDLQ